MFAGIGGLDAGVELATGKRVAWQLDLLGEAVRRRHWPGARQIVADCQSLTRRQLHRMRGIQVLCGGFPCQGLSAAGSRRGLSDPRSALYHAMIGAVDEFWPETVIIENVPGLLAYRARVDADLGLRGYGTVWVRCYAASVGAPHLRRRVFVVARRGAPVRDGVVDLPPGPGDGRAWPTPTAGDARASGGRTASAACHDGESLADAVVRYWATPTARDCGASGPKKLDGRRGELLSMQTAGRINPAWVEQLMGFPRGWADPARTGRLVVDPDPAWPMPRYPVDRPRDEPWPQYAWEAPRTMDGPPMRGRPAWLRALGNAVVPQQAAAAIRAGLGGGQ